MRTSDVDAIRTDATRHVHYCTFRHSCLFSLSKGQACNYNSFALGADFRSLGFCTIQVTSKLAKYFIHRRLQR
jgi:hypothetical protein